MGWTVRTNLQHSIPLIWNDTLIAKNLLPLREQIISCKSPIPAEANGMYVIKSISFQPIPFQVFNYAIKMVGKHGDVFIHHYCWSPDCLYKQ